MAVFMNAVWKPVEISIEGFYTILLKHVMSHVVRMHMILPRYMRCPVFLFCIAINIFEITVA